MDIRSKKTRRIIAECFLKLLQAKPVSKISVTEICQMAHINRATFYKHYLDIPDLQQSLEQEILEDFKGFLQSKAFSDNGTYRDMLVELVTYSRQFGGSFYVLCSANAASDLAARMFRLLDELSFPILKQKLPALEETKAKMLYDYITYGSGSVLSGWLSGEGEMSVEEVADFIMLCSGVLAKAVAAAGKEPG
ncbi:MAG: TetR/AcrR family transcriptional regulator [Faecousia sp.]